MRSAAGNDATLHGLMMTIIFLHDVTKYIHNSASNPQVIKIYTLISSFMPAISALSGNLGLQAGSNTIRGLGTGEPETDSVDIRVDNYIDIVQGTSTRVTTCPTWCGRSGAASSPPASSPQCWPGSPWSGHTATGTTSTSSKSRLHTIEKYLSH